MSRVPTLWVIPLSLATFWGLCSQGMAQQAVQPEPKPRAQQPPQPGGQPVEKSSEYLRLVKKDSGNPSAMETAIVRFVPTNCGQTGPTVDLIAAVHIAEKSYYRKLNEEFKKYDAVLYELVAPEGTKIPKGGTGRSRHPISAIQKGMTQLLELTYQLEEVDYTAKNFVHADMSPGDLSKAMENRGESLWTMLVRSMGYAMAKQHKSGATSDADLLMALLDRNRALALKRVMAEQFQDMEGMTRAMGGPNGSALIADRNQAALKVLREQIAKGKRKIAIFYGAGHMADMEKRLRGDFAMTPINTRWLVAWDLRGGAKAKQRRGAVRLSFPSPAKQP